MEQDDCECSQNYQAEQGKITDEKRTHAKRLLEDGNQDKHACDEHSVESNEECRSVPGGNFQGCEQ